MIQFYRPIFFIIFYFLALNSYGTNQYQKIIDNRIHIFEGLSQGRITSIIEDERGYMWFGTTDGLNRYDGYTFKSYKTDSNNPDAIPGNSINCITKDAQGNLWVGTNNGLAMLNIYSEKFIPFIEKDSEQIYQGANKITSCSIDQNQNVWCSTNGAGIFCIEKDSPSRQYKSELSLEKVIPTILVDKDNRLWIGVVHNNSLQSVNLNDYSTASYKINTPFTPPFEKASCQSMYQDSTGRIWMNIANITRIEGGLYYLDTQKNEIVDVCCHFSEDFIEQFRQYLFVIASITGDPQGNIYPISTAGLYFKISPKFVPTVYFEEGYKTGDAKLCIYKCQKNLLWLGQNGGGIQLSKSQSKDFETISNQSHSSFMVKSIRAIFEDQNYYWVGGYNALIKINKLNKTISPTYIEIPSIYGMAPVLNKPDYLWIGTEGDGLILYNKKTNSREKNIRFDDAKLPDNYLNNIYCIKQLSDTLVLMGTYGGLVGYNPLSGSHQFYSKVNSNDLSRLMQVNTITTNMQGNILVGYTQGEIGIFDIENNCIQNFPLLETTTQALNATIKCIYNAPNSDYWIATSKGLLHFQMESGIRKLLTTENGLPNNFIYSILPDNDGKLWLSTNMGLSCYNPLTQHFQNYNKSDGLQSNEFNTGAYYKAKDGTLFFGGIKGLNYFDPAQVHSNRILPNIEINSIEVGNKQLELSDEIACHKQLVLEPHQNMFTIDFVGLSYLNSSLNKYKYRIKEIDHYWIDLGHRHYISFNNMRHGNYTLEILASNNHGEWLKEPYVLHISIEPRFYETTWFTILVLILSLILILATIRIRLIGLKHQRKKLELLVEEQTHYLKVVNENLQQSIEKQKNTSEKLRVSNNTKDTFLSIIAHDILNPLGSIIGLSEHLYTETDTSHEEKQTVSRLIHVSANNLKDLLYNLIQWTKLEQNKLTSKADNVVVKHEMDNCLQLLEAAFDQKHIQLELDINKTHVAYADQNMVSAIFRNILSNALKFTPQNGSIKISSTYAKEFVSITIKDTGVGMEAEILKKILDTNKDLSTRGTNNEMGTGIGLNLVLRFIKQCDGKIDIISSPKNGTEVQILLPTPTKIN